MKNNEMVDIMSERGFILTRTNGKEFTFINIDPEIDIICEVKENGTFEFVYTNKEMFGILRSGEFGNVENQYGFERILFMFLRTVNKLR